MMVNLIFLTGYPATGFELSEWERNRSGVSPTFVNLFICLEPCRIIDTTLRCTDVYIDRNEVQSK